MPELPEVETVRIGLNKLIVGKKVAKVSFDWPKSYPNSPNDTDAFLVGSNITNVSRRAKVLMIDLSTNYSLVIHLKMTGQLVFVPKTSYIVNSSSDIGATLSTKYEIRNTKTVPEARFGAGHPNDSLIGKLPDKSTRVTIRFTDKSHLFFNDQRKFGWMRLIPTAEIPNINFMKKVGPEPLEATFTYGLFLNQVIRRKNSNIKAVLLDQTIVAGIGNIYADETLFLAGIHPESVVGSVPKLRLKNLHQAIIDVLTLSIEKGGSTDRNYVNAEGKKGSYIEFAKVFRKENQPCPNNCGSIINKIRVAGRGTHVCSKCQNKYSRKTK